MPRPELDQEPDLTPPSAVFSGLLGLAGLALVGLVAYALLTGFDRRTPHHANSQTLDIAILFPAQTDWLRFRQGIQQATRTQNSHAAAQHDTALAVLTPSLKIPVLFTWYQTQGEWELKTRLTELMQNPARKPLAVVGSSNTALTATLARRLSEAPDPSALPLLLIPRASAVSAGSAQPLLALYPGRSFRYCLNNARMADLVVSYSLQNDAAKPRQAWIIQQPEDPCSLDLAAAFEAALHRASEGRTPIPSRRLDPVSPAASLTTPDATPSSLFQSIWTAAAQTPPGQSFWLVLTLQGKPARDFLHQLQAARPTGSRIPPLTVLCGDGLGRPSLAQLAGSTAFTLRAVSSEANPLPTAAGAIPPLDAQLEAEIAASLIAAIDQGARTPEHLRDALLAQSIPPRDSRSPTGRSIAFEHGERAGPDIGHVLEIQPGSPVMLSHVPVSPGTWTDFDWCDDHWSEHSNGSSSP